MRAVDLMLRTLAAGRIRVCAKAFLQGIDADTATPGRQAFHLGATPDHTGDIVISYDAGSNQTALWFSSTPTPPLTCASPCSATIPQ